MPQLIQHPEDLLIKLKRDIFVLMIKGDTASEYDAEFPDEDCVAEIIQWLNLRGVATRKIAGFADIEIILGWPGWYHANFQGWDDPNLLEYSSLYEDSSGNTLEPHRFQIMGISYDKWVEDGGPEKYEEYLDIINDPDYCP